MTAIFANKVRKALHKKIKGYSKCWVQDDVLVADIQPCQVENIVLYYNYV